VGMTDHRWGLTELKRVDRAYARQLIDRIDAWQKRFRKECGRGFVYASDEFYIVAGRELPAPKAYDGFPQIENGVGMTRIFLTKFKAAARRLPARLPKRRTLTLVTGTLASGLMEEEVLPALRKVKNLTVDLAVARNTLFGKSVTVSGLLSGKCVYSAVRRKGAGDLVLLPPDILNADGVFLDDMTIPQLERSLQTPVHVFDGSWARVMRSLTHHSRS